MVLKRLLRSRKTPSFESHDPNNLRKPREYYGLIFSWNRWLRSKDIAPEDLINAVKCVNKGLK